MNLVITDYNGSDGVVKKGSAQEWAELERVLKACPLYLKASDQAGKQGSAIFDPVATNEFIRDKLRADHGWATNIRTSAEYAFLGTDIDAGKNGVMVEVQFSNYPFLLNNMLRSELFFQGKFQIGGRATALAVIATKSGMFPASNSTLYYEQAKKQLERSSATSPARAAAGLSCASRPAAESASRYLAEFASMSVSRPWRPARADRPTAPLLH